MMQQTKTRRLPTTSWTNQTVSGLRFDVSGPADVPSLSANRCRPNTPCSCKSRPYDDDDASVSNRHHNHTNHTRLTELYMSTERLFFHSLVVYYGNDTRINTLLLRMAIYDKEPSASDQSTNNSS